MMMTLRCICLLAAVAMLTTSCSTNGRSSAERKFIRSEFEAVAGIGNDETKDNIVRTELAKNGIWCLMSGSVVYDILVPKSQVKKARKVLLESPNIKREWLLFKDTPIKGKSETKRER